MSAAFHPTLEDLPRVLPVFPLAGALLIPAGRLPLNIFEPRYLNMVEDALGLGRMIGMIQPHESALSREARDPGQDAPPRSIPEEPPPALYGVGCAGRIASFSETDDGRFLITLTGVCRFKVRREMEQARGYRRVEADYKPFAHDLDLSAIRGAAIDRKRLFKALKPYLKFYRIGLDLKSLEGLTDAALIIALSMVCPFVVREKQALLEVPTMDERGETLIALLEMAVIEAGGFSQAKR